MSIRLSLVIPAYREELVIGQSLDSIYDFLQKESLLNNTEVVVVTADTPDKTHEIVNKKTQRFTHFQHLKPGPKVGKGRDVRHGITHSRGNFIIFTDADLATPIHHISTALHLLENGKDIVAGVRDLGKIHAGDKTRTFISNAASITTRTILGLTIGDTQCGFKGFTRQSADLIFPKLSILQWGFDMEILKIAQIHKMNVGKVPIKDWRDPKLDSGLVGESSIGAAITTLSEVMRIRIRSWQGKY